ncbi:hypothetical protein T01_12565 [Trichinella spiralis]|uniref:Uncharacterized protein n=1 Tax=Trichinella spiralis TaxID=6334 RepID=A0A0V1AVH5_TRISP|nr:hypothetical protein T01_12565 [Trichinella spiralis]
MLALTVNSGSKMLGRSTCKSLSHNFPLLLITAAVCYQVAVTWALDNTAMGKNGLLYDKQNRTETMKRNISNEYLPNENAENNNKTDVKATVFETPTEKENITEFVIKAPQTPITLTPQTTTPIPTNFSEKVEPANNRSKEHTDEILNVVNGSKTYGNDNVSEKLKAGKTNGSDVEFETPPPNFVITSTLAPINCTQTLRGEETVKTIIISVFRQGQNRKWFLSGRINSGSKMLGRSTCKSLSHNFPLLLITAAVCYQVAVTWALDNTAMGKNGLLYDKQNRTETMKRNISNEYLPNENAENNNKTDVKATVFETPTEKENITEFVIKAPQTPITLTPQTTTPIPTNFSEKVEPANNRSKEHTDEILNVVNGSKTYGNDNASEKLKAGKTNGSDVEFETPPPNFVITSTLAPIICTQTVNYKGTNRKLNQTNRYTARCEEDHVEKFCIALSVIFAGMCLIAIIIFCVCFFQPTNMLRSIAERRRNGENHRNFCISTRAEQEMVSFGEKLNEA